VKPNLEKLRAQLANVEATQQQANTEITARRDQGKDQLKQISARFQTIQYEIPNYQNIKIEHGSKLEAIIKNINAMSRSINSAMGDAKDSIDGVGSLEKNKESGALRTTAGILNEMQNDINATPIPADTLAMLPSFPSIFNELEYADSDMIRAVDASRVSLTLLDSSLGDLDAFFKELARTNLDFRGDISQRDYDYLAPMEQKAINGFNNAATAASQANQVFNMARARQLSAQITLLGVGTSPQRYSTLAYALQKRFGIETIDYTTMLKDGITAGDVVVSTIVAADIRSTPDEIVDEMVRDKRSPVDLADSHGMHAWPLEIFTGLIYLDYTDNPETELHPT
jgi:hypothetical protein